MTGLAWRRRKKSSSDTVRNEVRVNVAVQNTKEGECKGEADHAYGLSSCFELEARSLTEIENRVALGW